MHRATSSDSSRARRSSRIAVVGAVAMVCGCDPGAPLFYGHGPLDPYDESDDATERCEAVEQDPPHVPLTRCLRVAPEVPAATYSLCACGDIVASNTVTSQGGAVATDIGANDGWVSSAPIDVAGTITSDATMRADNTLAADGIVVESVLIGSNDVRIRGDATVGGMSFPQARVTVGGTLTIPEDAPLAALVTAGDIELADVEIDPPCECAASVDDIATFHDFDDELEDPHALIALTQPETLYFGCGDYHFSSIQSTNELELVIVGDTRIWIERDIDVSGPFSIEIEDGASLELFVGGRFVPTNTVELGNTSNPGALRMYVRDHVQLASPWELAGSLFAPDANVIVSNTLELRGAIYGDRFELSSPVTLRDGPRFTGEGCLVP
jgi:hypothetical protein